MRVTALWEFCQGLSEMDTKHSIQFDNRAKIGRHFPNTIKGFGLLFQLTDEPVFIKCYFSEWNKFQHHFRGLVLTSGASMLSGIRCFRSTTYNSGAACISFFNLIEFFNIFSTWHIFCIHFVGHADTSWHNGDLTLPSP